MTTKTVKEWREEAQRLNEKSRQYRCEAYVEVDDVAHRWLYDNALAANAMAEDIEDAIAGLPDDKELTL